MRKTFFLWFTVILFVLLLITAFENIFVGQQFSVLFYTIDDISSLFVILFSSLLGFLVCFFMMLYSHEVRREKELQEQEDTVGAAPASLVEKTDKAAPEEEKKKTDEGKVDVFDEDDETLG
mgnify:CR=1 FL=1